MSSILILTTASSYQEANVIARQLLKARLAACVTISAPAESYFWWDKKIERAKERVLLIKTKKKLYKKIEKAILMCHSYEVPEIISLPIQKGSTKYLNWLCSVTA